MNTPKPPRHDVSPQDPRWQREWQAQEHAFEQERHGLPLDASDARDGEYRLIARALRTPAMEPLPADLTAQILAHVAQAQELGERIEQWLLRGLVTVMALAALVVVAMYGASWWPAFTAVWPAQAGGWLGLVGACLGASLLAQRWPGAAWRPA